MGFFNGKPIADKKSESSEIQGGYEKSLEVEVNIDMIKSYGNVKNKQNEES